MADPEGNEFCVCNPASPDDDPRRTGRDATPTTELTAGIQERVIGARWGANGYTTLEQADELARRLALGPGTRVLDMGTGRGWPGVYYAVTYCCDVVGTDMPIDAVAAAAERSAKEGAGRRFHPVVAAAATSRLGPPPSRQSSIPTSCVE